MQLVHLGNGVSVIRHFGGNKPYVVEHNGRVVDTFDDYREATLAAHDYYLSLVRLKGKRVWQ